MRKIITLGIMLLFLGMTISSSTGLYVEKQSIKPMSFGNTLYVGGNGTGNYTKIQDAINDSSNGDTVYVYDDSSPYYESIHINKAINLKGEDKDTTIIDGNKTNDVIQILVDNASVSGFTIRDSGKYEKGIYVSSNHTIISGNIVTGYNEHTIQIEDGRYNTITNNILTNSSGFCIYLLNGDYNIVTENTISHSEDGIRFTYSSQNHIGKNIIHDNRWGIWVQVGDNNYITGNIIYNNYIGIETEDGYEIEITHNLIYNHSNNGIEIESVGNIITDNTIRNNDDGLVIWGDVWGGAENRILYNNFIENNRSAIVLRERQKLIWDDGERGNYWDDYTGVDENHDNIGDIPYKIDYWDGYYDTCPFMTPYPYDQDLPSVEIKKPQKALYIMNEALLPRFVRLPLIIGDIDIEVNAFDDSGIQRVEFFIDNKQVFIDWDYPYTMSWSKDRMRIFRHLHILKIVAYDYAGKKSEDTVIVWKFF